MASADSEIVVDDPQAPSGTSAPVTSTRAVEMIVYVVLLVIALVLGFDNWRTGMGWAKDGPQSGYLPFYLCVILAAASLYGFGAALAKRNVTNTFVTRDQLRRVMQVFVPTLAFVALVQWVGIYLASLLLVAGFMRFIGRIAWWKALLTSVSFAVMMFVTFEIAFDVIMPKGPLEALFGF